eukprot:scaffold198729_cov44-Prasinocladus_malaysianus.AAC.1
MTRTLGTHTSTGSGMARRLQCVLRTLIRTVARQCVPRTKNTNTNDRRWRCHCSGTVVASYHTVEHEAPAGEGGGSLEEVGTKGTVGHTTLVALSSSGLSATPQTIATSWRMCGA